MSDSTESRPELLDALGAGPVGVTSPEEIARERARMLPWLEDQVEAFPERRRELSRRSRVRRVAGWGGVVLAAAAALAGVLFFRDMSPAEPGNVASNPSSQAAESNPIGTVVSGRLRAGSENYGDGQTLALGGRVETSDVGAALQVSHGYQLELGPSSALTFETNGAATGDSLDRLHLHHGLAKLAVLPQPKGASLQIVTGDALVLVVKSAFSIEAAGGKSCVRVSEGSVTVRRGAVDEVVRAGGALGCVEEPEVSETLEQAPESRQFAPAQRATTLSQENALLSRALAAESRGDDKTAREAYRELLSKYPRSSFAQDARAGLARLGRSIK